MQPDHRRADDPLTWLVNARADLALARVQLPPGGLYEHLCFHAQQAAEKSIKAVLLKLGVSFPFTHSLQALIDALPTGQFRSTVPAGVVDLTPYAVTTRYPGEDEPVSEDEYRDALKLAEDAVAWAASMLTGPIGRS